MNRLFPFLCLVFGACCLAPPRTSRLADIDYPWELVSLERLPEGLFWHQKIRASFDGREVAFEAILQKSGEELLVLGLTPMGTKAFALRQTGLVCSFEKFVDQEIPFPARFILVDIQRCFFPLAAAPADDTDGVRIISIGQERVEESWRGGRLDSRTFERPGQSDGARIRVDYEDWSADGTVPERVQLDNGWFGYVLTIQTAKGG